MPGKLAKDKAAERAKKNLGSLISKCRGNLNQAQLAKKIGLPRSNMKYIEDGINTPTADVYEKLIKELKPSPGIQRRMDNLYMAIRKVPPPDISRIIADNKDLVVIIRKLKGCRLTTDQMDSISDLFTTIAYNREGDKVK